MTVPEYYAWMRELEKLPAEEKEFLKNICRIVDHEFFKDLNEMADVCIRCEHEQPWRSALDKIAKAMAAPLKQSLDYQGISKKFIEVSEISKPADWPIYDKDIPSQDSST